MSAAAKAKPSPWLRIEDLADAIKDFALGEFDSVAMCKSMAKEIIMQCEIIEERENNERSEQNQRIL